jgi:pSer/pThr/pTyr-binding forkhead associated (FHA) protein
MSRLILSLDGQVMAEYNMNRERYTIGRLPDNDVRIDNPAVSGHHSLIINILNDSFLEDLNSTNGTYVNGKLIKKHALQHGDQITIGHHTLRFIEQQAEEAEQDEFEKTMVISPAARGQREIHRQAEKAAQAATAHTATASAVDSAPAPAATQAVTARLQVLTGSFAGRELELVKGLTTLGQPGRQVVAITRRQQGYYIVHVSGDDRTERPSVNGQPVGGHAIRLEDGDVIELVGVKMGFFAKS